MSIVNSIETVREWLGSTVCPMVQLKLPDDSATDASYPYKLVNPTAFSLFVRRRTDCPQRCRPPSPRSACRSWRAPTA